MAKGGAPYWSEHALHVVLASGSAALLLFAAPFPRLVRLLLPFSYYFGYEYAVIARTYALSVLLLLVIAMLHSHRHERPLGYAIAVALLANTNVHSLFVAALVGLGHLLERPKARTIAIMLAGGLLAAAQVWPAADAMVHGVVSVFHPDAPAQAVGAAFFPLPAVPRSIAIALGLAIVIASLFAVRASRFAMLVLLGSYAFFGYLFVFKWLGGFRHFGFVLLVLLFALWIGKAERSLAWALLTMSIAVSVFASGWVWRLDWKFAFSGAKEMAQYIHTRGLASYTIAAHSQTTASALCPYFDQPFWFAGIEDFGTFSKWDGRFARGLEVTYPEAVRRVASRFSDRSRVLLLLNVEIPAPERNGWRLLYHNQRPQFANLDETFWLYGALP